MYQKSTSQSKTRGQPPYGWIALTVAAAVLIGSAIFLTSPAGAGMRGVLKVLFVLDSGNVTWMVTRASGIIAYLLLWISTVWGLALPTKFFDSLVHRSAAFEFHQTISLLALFFLGVHMFILLADTFLPFSLVQILIPFTADYKPLWVGIGVLAFYISVLVTVTFYIRPLIGKKAFRTIHYTSLIAYLGAMVHALFAGTDSSLTSMSILYGSTFLVFIFMVAYWIISAGPGRSVPIPGRN